MAYSGAKKHPLVFMFGWYAVVVFSDGSEEILKGDDSLVC